jgi:hypothetical protein
MAKKQRAKKVARYKRPQRKQAYTGGEQALRGGYEFAVQQGFEGTYMEWLQSLGSGVGGNYSYIPGGNTKDPDIIIDDGEYIGPRPGQPGFDPAKQTSTKRGEIGYDPAAGFVTQPEAPVIEKAEPIKYETIPGQPVSDKATWKKKEEENKDEDPRDGARRGGIRRKAYQTGGGPEAAFNVQKNTVEKVLASEPVKPAVKRGEVAQVDGATTGTTSATAGATQGLRRDKKQLIQPLLLDKPQVLERPKPLCLRQFKPPHINQSLLLWKMFLKFKRLKEQ